MPTTPQVLFFGFATLLLLAAGMTVFSRQPVKAALSLVLSFFAAAALWILMTAEFLGLVLVLVYVGAVMTLFLFVLMTLPGSRGQKTGDRGQGREKWAYRIPSLAVVVWLGLMLYTVQKTEDRGQRTENSKATSSEQSSVISPLSSDSNPRALGMQLYTEYAYPFELAGVLLLVAIIAAIVLTQGEQRAHKSIPKQSQLDVQRSDRVRLVQMGREAKL